MNAPTVGGHRISVEYRQKEGATVGGKEGYCGIGAKVEAGQDLTLYGEVGRIHSWIRRANAVLGIKEGDESGLPKVVALIGRVEDCVTYLNDPLGVRLEVILSELQRLTKLVG